jgi:branched-chain amino acid transport system permease protein
MLSYPNGPVKGFEVQRATRASRVTATLLGVALLAAASAPWWAGRAAMHDFVQFSAYLVFALMWNLLAGYGGMVSIGQQAFFGIGGYSMLILTTWCGVSPFIAVPLAGLIAMLVALPVSLVAFRLDGGYFAIGTWVIAEVFRLTFANIAALGGGSGTSLIALEGIPRVVREAGTLWLALGIVIVSLGAQCMFLRSKAGLALTAMRDSAVAARSQGVNVSRARLVVYLASACGAALAGGLYFLGNLRLSPDAAFSVNWTAFGIFIVLIGGIGTLEGPIVGALVFFVLNRFLSDFGTWYLIGLGGLAIVVTMYFPQGLWGYVSRRFDLHLFPLGRRLVLSASREPHKPAESGAEGALAAAAGAARRA